MTYSLLHNGLIKAPCWGGPAICWLRHYRQPGASPESVVVLTEVPGNPGRSIGNAHENLTVFLENEFGVRLDSLALFHVWPADFSDPPTWTAIDPQNGEATEDTTRAAVERIVGEALSDLPAHDVLYAGVLALGGGNWQEHIRPLFEAFPVDQLPVPHNPAGCAHIDRFRRIRASVAPELDRSEADQLVGRRFLESLSDADRARCWRHDADWSSIANASVEILNRLGRCDPEEYADAAESMGLEDQDERWLVSLFADPIFIGGGGYTNGQHRACALRFSGAARAAIAIDDEVLGKVCTDWWTYTDGG